MRSQHDPGMKGQCFITFETVGVTQCWTFCRYTFPDAKGDHVRLVTVRPAVKTPKPQATPIFPGYDSRAAAKHAAVNVVNYVSGVAGSGLPAGVPGQHAASLQQHLGQWMYHQQQGAAAAAAAAAVSAASLHSHPGGSIGMSMNPAPGGYGMGPGTHSSGFVSPQGMPSSHRSSSSGVKDSPRGQLPGPMYRSGSQMGQQMQGSQGLPMTSGMPASANSATAAAVAAAAAAAAQGSRPQQVMHSGWGQQPVQGMHASAGSADGGYINGSGQQGVSADQQAYILQAMANMQIAMSQGATGSSVLQTGALEEARQGSMGSGAVGTRSGSAGAPMNRASATGSGNSTSGHFDAPGQTGPDHSGWQ